MSVKTKLTRTPAKFEGLQKMKTKTKIIFSTNEPVDFEMIESLRGLEGNLAFSPDHIKKEVENAMKDRKLAIREDGRSHSEILRGTFNVLWRQGYFGNVDFETAYAFAMENLIEHYKSKIEDEA